MVSWQNETRAHISTRRVTGVKTTYSAIQTIRASRPSPLRVSLTRSDHQVEHPRLSARSLLASEELEPFLSSHQNDTYASTKSCTNRGPPPLSPPDSGRVGEPPGLAVVKPPSSPSKAHRAAVEQVQVPPLRIQLGPGITALMRSILPTATATTRYSKLDSTDDPAPVGRDTSPASAASPPDYLAAFARCRVSPPIVSRLGLSLLPGYDC